MKQFSDTTESKQSFCTFYVIPTKKVNVLDEHNYTITGNYGNSEANITNNIKKDADIDNDVKEEPQSSTVDSNTDVVTKANNVPMEPKTTKDTHEKDFFVGSGNIKAQINSTQNPLERVNTYSLDLSQILSALDDILNNSISVTDRTLAVYIRNNLGNVPAKFKQDSYEKKIDDALNTCAAFNFKFSPHSYKCYPCHLAWWHLSEFKNHLDDQHYSESDNDGLTLTVYYINSDEYYIAANFDSGIVDAPIPIKGLCSKCGGDYSYHTVNYRHNKRSYVCQGCGALFSTCLSFKEHEHQCRKVSPLDPNAIECSLCSTVFRTTVDLDNHMLVCHDVRSDVPEVIPHEKCNLCGRSYTTSYTHHCPLIQRLVQCRYCYRTFINVDQAESHIGTSNEPIICKICHLILPKKCMETEHMLMHDNVTSKNFMFVYRCMLCVNEVVVLLDDAAILQHRHSKHLTFFEKLLLEKIILPVMCLFSKNIKINKEVCSDTTPPNAKPSEEPDTVQSLPLPSLTDSLTKEVKLEPDYHEDDVRNVDADISKTRAIATPLKEPDTVQSLPLPSLTDSLTKEVKLEPDYHEDDVMNVDADISETRAIAKPSEEPDTVQSLPPPSLPDSLTEEVKLEPNYHEDDVISETRAIATPLKEPDTVQSLPLPSLTNSLTEEIKLEPDYHEDDIINVDDDISETRAIGNEPVNSATQPDTLQIKQETILIPENYQDDQKCTDDSSNGSAMGLEPRHTEFGTQETITPKIGCIFDKAMYRCKHCSYMSPHKYKYTRHCMAYHSFVRIKIQEYDGAITLKHICKKCGQEVNYTNYETHQCKSKDIASKKEDTVRNHTLTHSSTYQCYEDFLAWKILKGESNLPKGDEDILLEYFTELSETLKAQSLWLKYSLIKSSLSLYDDIDIENFNILIGFLRHTTNGYELKSITAEHLNKFLNEAPDESHLLTKILVIFRIVTAAPTDQLYTILWRDVKVSKSAVTVNVRCRKTKSCSSFTITGRYHLLCKKYIELRPKPCNSHWFFMSRDNSEGIWKRVHYYMFENLGTTVAQFLRLPLPECYTGKFYRRLRFN